MRNSGLAESGVRAGAGSDRRIEEVAGRLREELEGLAHELTVHIPGKLGLQQSQREYHAVVERQQTVRRRIRLVGRLLAGLPLVDAGTLRCDRVGYGSIVFLQDLDTGHEATFMLMARSADPPPPGEGPIDSPLGNALLGCRAGSEVVLMGSDRDVRFRLLALYTLPYCLGLGG